MRNSLNDEELLQEIVQFRDSFSVATLATASIEGIPEASNAPFVRGSDGNFFIFVSLLARHSQYLINNPHASILFMEQPTNRPNPFALRRLQYQCEAWVVEDDEGEIDRTGVVKLFKAKFGRFVDTLDALGDFKVICLSPVSGKYVKGFAQTFTLSGEGMNQIDHVNPGKA